MSFQNFNILETKGSIADELRHPEINLVVGVAMTGNECASLLIPKKRTNLGVGSLQG